MISIYKLILNNYFTYMENDELAKRVKNELYLIKSITPKLQARLINV